MRKMMNKYKILVKHFPLTQTAVILNQTLEFEVEEIISEYGYKVFVVTKDPIGLGVMSEALCDLRANVLDALKCL